MFFVLSKLLFFLFQPLNWVVAFLLGGVFWRNPRWRKRFLVLGAALLVWFTNPLALNLVHRGWEPEAVAISSLDEPFDVGIVLGGYSRVVEEFPDRMHLTRHPNRLTHALELYQAGKVRRLLLSGGSPRLIGKKITDAEQVRSFLLRSGVEAEDIIVESASRNTHENAVFSVERIRKDFPGARCLLITSAVHMRRAAACFRKEGMEVAIFPTDSMGEPVRGFSPGEWLIPHPMSFAEWESLSREWAGFVVYSLRGYL